jgi:hypothetical protein
MSATFDDLKKRGNEFYAAQKFESALLCYAESLNLLDSQSSPDGSSDATPDTKHSNQLEALRETRVVLNSNRAECFLKLERHVKLWAFFFLEACSSTSFFIYD